jgi:competence protein ComEC
MKLRLVPKVNRTVIICFFLASICMGIMSATFSVDVGWYLLIAIIPIGLLAIKKRGVWLICSFVIAGFGIGLMRGSTFMSKVNLYEEYFDKTVVVMGRVSDDPGYTDKKLTEFHLTNVKLDDTLLPGRVRVRSQSANSVSRGDLVEAKGKFRRTLGTGRQGSISYASVIVVKSNTSWVEKMRKRFFASVYSSLPEPQASLGIGYLLGVRTALPADFTIALSAVGLTHIVAVSGYNLTIIVQFVKRIFSKVSAYQTVLFSGLLIAGFLVMTGWSPSITRAAIISGFSLLAWYYGRTFKPLTIILLGAAITSFVNPLYIWGDVGWYLSFLAFSGVLIVAPLIMFFLGGKVKNIMVVILIETLSAQLLTLPYISVIFGRLSLISPIANILVVPFIPISMLLIFITGIVGMVSPGMALWVAVPAKIIMTITVWFIERLSSLSWAQSSLKISVWLAAMIYIALFVSIGLGWLVYHKRTMSGGEKIDWNLL